MEVKFIVLGEPVPKARPRAAYQYGKIHMYTPKKTVDYEKLIALEYKRQCYKVFDERTALKMGVRAFCSPPKTANGKKITEEIRQKMLSGEIVPIGKPDCDNLLKSVADALNGIAYTDDKQIVEMAIRKQYSDKPRIEVVLMEYTK